MITIISEHGYPYEKEALARVEYFIKVSPSECGILIVGKDSQKKKYTFKNDITKCPLLRGGKKNGS